MQRRESEALACGALQPIETRCEPLQQAGVEFQIRLATKLEIKRKVTQARPPDFDPFLPYEEALFVCDARSDHVVLFNKFNVIERHLLVVTREFVHQDEPLDEPDFAALSWCWARFDGLAFYNCGKVSGASQRHKHLQLVPRLCEDRHAPVEARLDLDAGRVEPFSFRHRVAALPGSATPADLRDVYETLMRATGATGRPYNLLATPRWMMVVPRRREHSGPASINALGFAGSLFVRNEEELAMVRERGPLAILDDVTEPA